MGSKGKSAKELTIGFKLTGIQDFLQCVPLDVWVLHFGKKCSW